MKKVLEINKFVTRNSDGSEWDYADYPSFSDKGTGKEWLNTEPLSLEEAKELVFEISEEALDYAVEIEEAEDLQELQNVLVDLKDFAQDNTYNTSWWGGVVDFGVLTDDSSYGEALIILRMHRGGDPRGNYSEYEAFKLDSYAEDFPPYADTLTYQLTTEDGMITLDTDDFEGYNLNVVEDETGTYEENDMVSLDDIEDDFDMDGKSVYGFGGGVAVGGIVGAYLGYKIGRMRPQKAGFETEKKIGRRIKKEGKKIAGDMTISKKKPQTMAKGGGLKEEDNSEENLRQELRSGKITQNQFNLRTKARELNTPTYSHLYEIRDREKDGFNEVWGRFKDRTRKDFGGDKYAEGGGVNWDKMDSQILEYGKEFALKNKQVNQDIKKIVKDNGGATDRNDIVPRIVDFVDEFEDQLINSSNFAKGGWLIGGKKAFVFADGSKFIVELTKDKEGKQLPILVKTTQQDSTISILRDEKSLAQKTLEKAKEKNIDFKTLLIRLKNGGVFKKFYDTDGTYAGGGRVYEHLDKADSHLREAGSKLWQNKNPKSDEYKKAYDDFQDELMGIYTPREWNELDYAEGGEIKRRSKRKGDIGSRDKKIKVDTISGDRHFRVIYYTKKGDFLKEKNISIQGGIEYIDLLVKEGYPYLNRTSNNQIKYDFYDEEDNFSMSNRYMSFLEEAYWLEKGGNISYDLSDVI